MSSTNSNNDYYKKKLINLELNAIHYSLTKPTEFLDFICPYLIVQINHSYVTSGLDILLCQLMTFMDVIQKSAVYNGEEKYEKLRYFS